MTVFKWGTSAAELIEDSTVLTSRLNNLAPFANEGVYSESAFPVGLPTVDDIWISWHDGAPSGFMTDNNTILLVRDAANNRDLFRLRSNGGINSERPVFLQYYDGATWNSIGSGQSVPATGVVRLDVHIKMHGSGGALAWYLNGSLAESVSGVNTIHNTSVALDRATYFRRTPNSQSALSAFIFADTDTRAMHYAGPLIDGDGALAEMSGDFEDIDGTGHSDASFLFSDSADQRSTFTKAALPSALDTGYNVLGLGVTVRARTNPEGAAGVRAMVTSDGTPAVGGDIPLGLAFGPIRHLFTDDPDTNAAWTITGANAAQVGVQSRAV